jgi:putative MATE family efflux protein
MNLQEIDMTKGNTARNTARLFGPLLGAFFLNILYDLTDSLWIGGILGETALAVQTICIPVSLLFIAACMGAANGAAIVFSRYIGAKDKAKTETASATAFRITLLCICVIVPLLEFFIRPLLAVLNTPAALYHAAKMFLGIHILSFPAVALYMYISAILRSRGNTVVPMAAVLFSTVLNAVLDPVFIHFAGLNGVVLVTVITQTLMAVITAVYCGLQKTEDGGNLFGFSLRHILSRDMAVTGELFRNAVPSLFQQIMPSISAAVITSLVGKSGIIPLAAYGAACKMEIMLLYPSMAINMTLTAAAGQCFGAGLKTKARSYLHWGMIESGSLLAVLTVLVLLFQHTFSGFFGIGEEAKRIVGNYFLIISAGYICNGITNCFLGSLNGAGHPEISMGIMVVYYLFIRIPLALFLSSFSGLTGIWTAVLVSHVGALLIAGFVSRFGPFLTRACSCKE